MAVDYFHEMMSWLSTMRCLGIICCNRALVLAFRQPGSYPRHMLCIPNIIYNPAGKKKRKKKIRGLRMLFK